LELVPERELWSQECAAGLAGEASDGLGGTALPKALTVTITDVNEAPTDITLTPASIAETTLRMPPSARCASVKTDAGASAIVQLGRWRQATRQRQFSGIERHLVEVDPRWRT